MAQLTGAYVTINDLVSLTAAYGKVRKRKRKARKLTGDRFSRQRGRGVDFEEVRLYQPGDDVRNIDWNVTARKNEPHTKVFTEEREKPTLVVVDQTATMFFGSKLRLKSVVAAEIAARLAWVTLAQHDRVGGVVFGEDGTKTTKPLRNSRSVVKLLRDIAIANQALRVTNLQQAKEQLWENMITHLQCAAPHHHRIIVISDFKNISQDAIQELMHRGRHNELQVFHVYDELEINLPPANQYTVTSVANTIEFDSTGNTTKREYSRRYEVRVDRLKTYCVQNLVAFESLSTTENLDFLSLER
ncbi:MAG: DUF58 domain-containing protein [Gammaproteobacteria bacterium]|nr:DUF58 domain-containing protein [Gammaproteobacteria bacterium]MYF03305.1 DUF58 domain-containing protein [Gammaproteobacteria bacterium]MYI77260.1 DUF58 domain-containing protein [Gammaproteobacteria bacterium]